jgi:hypothetical protein
MSVISICLKYGTAKKERGGHSSHQRWTYGQPWIEIGVGHLFWLAILHRAFKNVSLSAHDETLSDLPRVHHADNRLYLGGNADCRDLHRT